MKFKSYLVELTKYVLSTSLVLGLVLGILILATGGVEGSITLDIDFSAVDSIWFLLGTPILLTTVLLLVSPLAYFVHWVAFRQRADKPVAGKRSIETHDS